MEELLLINPKARKRRRKAPKRAKRRAPKRRRNPIAAAPRRKPRRRTSKRVTARKRNPAPRRGFQAIVDNQLMPAAIGASGALALDVGLGYLPISEEIKTGPWKYVIKGAAAIAIGMLAEMVVKKRTAQEMAKGALTVVAHDAMREATENFLPNVPLSEYVSMGGVNEYVSMHDRNGLGYTSPAVNVGQELYNDVGDYVDQF